MNIPRSEHPRPDFERENWLCLNGEWDFSFDKPSFDKKITVPFTFETALSGIGDGSFHEKVFYRRRFTLPEDMCGKRVLLHFGAVDYECSVFLNGENVCRHRGGQSSFSCDVTEYVKPENELRVFVRDDPFDLSQTRGKQYWEREPADIFYPRTTGIWQTVWLEAVPDVYIKECRITPLFDERAVSFEYVLNGFTTDTEFCADVSFGGTTAARVKHLVTSRRGAFTVCLDERNLKVWKPFDVLTWSPEDPRLFDVELSLSESGAVTDSVKTYFGMRKVEIKDGEFLLNGRPYYQKLLLDQGYWRESLLTAPSDDAFIKDIELTKAMGFNGVRKHQKAEDPRFLYHADRLGLLVWGETAAAYVYNNDYARDMYSEWQEIVCRDLNHPCIAAWTPLNEGWGVQEIVTDRKQQAHSDALIAITKSVDGTRPVNDSDGWMHTSGDILGVHDYSDTGEKLISHFKDKDTILSFFPGGRRLFADGYSYAGQPVMLTEFGGVKYAPGGGETSWGYQESATAEEFLAKYRELVEAVYSCPDIKGFCYTQLTDVETEQNGLLTYDREPKTDLAKIKEINDEMPSQIK
ncbi:MAG: glycoside hydrolase family 2 [Clostridia bacterium]|nr:glycoside hydrolase family 2 [Clostridia bacterium]